MVNMLSSTTCYTELPQNLHAARLFMVSNGMWNWLAWASAWMTTSFVAHVPVLSGMHHLVGTDHCQTNDTIPRG